MRRAAIVVMALTAVVSFVPPPVGADDLVCPGGGLNTALARTAARPPGPPTDGPGSRRYPHDEVTVSGTSGKGGDFALYEPAGPNRPERAPVLVYLHGAQIDDRRDHAEAQLRHYARMGFIVLYADEGTVATRLYARQARKAIRDGVAELTRPGSGHILPDGRYAFVGHSLGGMVALHLAATWASGPDEIPRPAAVVLHDPAGQCYRDTTGVELSRRALKHLDPTTHLLIIQAEESVGAANSAAPPAWENSPVEQSRANWLVVPTDRHGRPTLESTHGGSLADPRFTVLEPLDAIDWWGYWRPTEAAVRVALGHGEPGYAVFCNERTARCDPVRRMGEWSDRHPAGPIRNAGDISRLPKPRP